MNVPNSLSLIRAALVIPLTIAIRADHGPVSVAVLLGIALITDLLDGALARRWGQITELGRVLDPIADKLLVGGGLLALALRGSVPMALAIVVILRDLAMLGAAWMRMRTGAPAPSATRAGKLAFALLGLYLGGVVVGIPWPAWGAALVGAVYVVAAVTYVRRFPRMLPGRILEEKR